MLDELLGSRLEVEVVVLDESLLVQVRVQGVGDDRAVVLGVDLDEPIVGAEGEEQGIDSAPPVFLVGCLRDPCLVRLGGGLLVGEGRGSLGPQSNCPLLVCLSAQLPDLELDLLAELAVPLVVEVFDLLLRKLGGWGATLRRGLPEECLQELQHLGLADDQGTAFQQKEIRLRVC